MARIYTKHGDSGETGLLYGGRVPKTDPRCEAYGTIDEVVSALGLSRALSASPKVTGAVKQLQRELFTVGAELSTDPAQYATMQRHFGVVSVAMVERLERLIDELETEVQLPPSFVIPGSSAASAALDLARTILRRAERRVVGLQELGLLVNYQLLRYLNRLSDLLFMLARYEDRDLPVDVLTSDR